MLNASQNGPHHANADDGEFFRAYTSVNRNLSEPNTHSVCSYTLQMK